MQLGNRKIQVGQIKLPIGKLEANRITIPGQASFANLFAGALSLSIGDGTKYAMTKNAAHLESGMSAHS